MRKKMEFSRAKKRLPKAQGNGDESRPLPRAESQSQGWRRREKDLCGDGSWRTGGMGGGDQEAWSAAE